MQGLKKFVWFEIIQDNKNADNLFIALHNNIHSRTSEQIDPRGTWIVHAASYFSVQHLHGWRVKEYINEIMMTVQRDYVRYSTLIRGTSVDERRLFDYLFANSINLK
jgi:hypothetical protein